MGGSACADKEKGEYSVGGMKQAQLPFLSYTFMPQKQNSPRKLGVSDFLF